MPFAPMSVLSGATRAVKLAIPKQDRAPVPSDLSLSLAAANASQLPHVGSSLA